MVIELCYTFNIQFGSILLGVVCGCGLFNTGTTGSLLSNLANILRAIIIQEAIINQSSNITPEDIFQREHAAMYILPAISVAISLDKLTSMYSGCE